MKATNPLVSLHRATDGDRVQHTVEVLRGTLDNGTDDHDHAANDDGKSTAKVVGQDGPCNQLSALLPGPIHHTGSSAYTKGMEAKLPIW